MKYLLIYIFSFFAITSQAIDVDYKKKFNDALKEIKKENYKKAIKLLKSAQKEKTHSKIAFWLSYSYAQTDDKELSLSYARLALEYEPELNETYNFRVKQIIKWCESSNQTTRSGRFPASADPPYYEIDESDQL